MKDFCCKCGNTIDSCPCSETTIEYCPHHDGEVEIDADNPTKCPECGIEILPCSTCDELKRGCNWEEGFGCWRFPKNNRDQEVSK